MVKATVNQENSYNVKVKVIWNYLRDNYCKSGKFCCQNFFGAGCVNKNT